MLSSRTPRCVWVCACEVCACEVCVRCAAVYPSVPTGCAARAWVSCGRPSSGGGRAWVCVALGGAMTPVTCPPALSPRAEPDVERDMRGKSLHASCGVTGCALGARNGCR